MKLSLPMARLNRTLGVVEAFLKNMGSESIAILNDTQKATFDNYETDILVDNYFKGKEL